MKISTIFIVGVLALLLSSMPNTIQTFSGSHEYDNKECEECHSNNINTGNVMASISCTGCHDDNCGSHLIDSPACDSVDCHPPGIHQVLYDAADPHRNLAVNALESTTLRYDNEACFLCHANINVQFDFIRPQYIEFDIIKGEHEWNIQNLTEGQNVTHQISIERKGISHLWISGSEIQCIPCHTDITANLSAHYPSSEYSAHTTAHPTTGDQCLNCHQKSLSQHTARSVLCIECHNEDRTIDRHKGLFDQISGHPPQYQANICIGCHNENHTCGQSPGSPVSHFKVYLEPVYKVERN